MDDLEKVKNKSKAKSKGDGKLYREYMSKKPLYASKTKALKAVTEKLHALASKAGLSVEEFLTEAETSHEFKEEHLDALSLARQISFFRK